MSYDEALNNLLGSVVQDVKSYADRLHSQIQKLSDIGRALSSVTDINLLLEMIVDQARSFTNADAGTLYIMEGNRLRFRIVQNDTLNIRMGGKDGEAIPFSPVELKESNVSAFVALNGISVNIPDVYDTTLFDFTDPKNFDRATGYRTQSMLVVLLKNHEDDVIGVLQLLNAKDPDTGEVMAFSADCENLTEGLASQAAIAISKINLINDMENLFEAFVKVMATAIDAKSPNTGGHIRRVAHLTLTMAETIHQKKEGCFKDVSFNADAMHELRIASWMHDIGKVTTPVEIMEKATKLQTIFDRIHLIDLRMSLLREKTEKEGLQRKLQLMEHGADGIELGRAEEETKIRIEEIEEIRQFLQNCNEPSQWLDEKSIKRLQTIANMSYIDHTGNPIPYLTEDELENLSIRKGSINHREREKIKEHAYITLKMLQQIPFTKKIRNIPHFAAAHHECIDGSGYPLGLRGDEIPFEGKLMAVTDIAEALTASDRPYKSALSLEKVNEILRAMAEDGKLDPDLVKLFIEEGVYQKYKNKYEPDLQKTSNDFSENNDNRKTDPPDLPSEKTLNVLQPAIKLTRKAL
ncbi:MAG: HD family phosphohydrolase [Nitrospinaceae bacterium]|nr:MAG: HD family phosphohydrolase [Nitrospinaceae bacterium]